MKIKDGFIIREIVGQAMAIPAGDSFNGMIKLNETAVFLWKKMETDTTKEALAEALQAEYGIDAATAASAVDSFVAEMDKNGFLA